MKHVSWQQIHLDTTYANPAYRHPPQGKAIADTCQAVRNIISQAQQRQSQLFQPPRRYVVMVGSYLVGKERLALGMPCTSICYFMCARVGKDARQRYLFKQGQHYQMP